MKIKGVVKKHLGRGRELGFPTANLDAPSEIEEGIYVGWTKIDNPSSPPLIRHGGGGVPPLKVRGGGGELLPSLIFIGAAETFGETEKHCEVHILDFDGDLYGQKLEVELIQKLRENRKFDFVEKLVAQMKADERNARAIFNSINTTYAP